MKKAFFSNWIIMSIVIAVCSFVEGCKKPTECKVSHWPDPEVTISWDGCNDVKTLKDYFDCHDSAIYSNSYKTIQVRGFIKMYIDSSRVLTGLAICSDTIITPDHYILLGYQDGAPAFTYDSTCMSKLTGLIGPPYWHDGCCNSKLLLYIQKIEKY